MQSDGSSSRSSRSARAALPVQVPRQEAGRYFIAMVVPSAVAPQRQPLIEIGPLTRFAEAAGAPPAIGTMVTIPTGIPPAVATITLPSSSVVMPPTYFELVPSHPQLPAPGGVPPCW